jgi:hypothetical protein
VHQGRVDDADAYSRGSKSKSTSEESPHDTIEDKIESKEELWLGSARRLRCNIGKVSVVVPHVSHILRADFPAQGPMLQIQSLPMMLSAP